VKKKWRLVGSVVLVAVLAWRIDWAQAGAALARADWALWAAGLGVYLFAQAVSALRWRMLARVQGLGGSYGRYLGYYFIGMFFNLLLPTSIGGDMVRTWYLSTREADALPRERRRVAAFLSVIGDRLNGLVALIVVAVAAALVCPTPLPSWIAWIVAGLAGAMVAGLVAAPFLARKRPTTSRDREGAVEPSPPPHGRGSSASLLYWLSACAAEYRKAPGALLVATLLSFVVQGANVLLAGLMGLALGLSVPAAYYGILAPLVALAALLPISLNGMGLRELATVVLLKPMGVGAAEAVTQAVLAFAVAAAASLGGAGVLLLGRFPRPEEVRDDDHAVGGDSDQGRVRQPPAAA
jgi:uncharacterized protein (TIRG00374 family)